MILEHQNYIDNGWVNFPEELLIDKYSALLWLNEFYLCIYPGLNSREFNITEIDEDLTILYHKQQPRRFKVTELYFHK